MISETDDNQDISTDRDLSGKPDILDKPPAVNAKSSSRLIFWGFLLIAVTVLIVGMYYLLQVQNSRIEDGVKEGPNVQVILDRGKLVIGTDATYPPMESTDESGNLIGYDIDLGNKIAQELDVEVEFKDIAWDDLFNALLEGDVDIIIAGVSITEDRKKLYDFSDSYLNAGQVIITQKVDNTIKTTSDLSNKRVGAQKGTTNEQEALKYTKDANVIRYKDFEQATLALVNGEVDAIFSDLTNAKSIISENRTLKIASEPFTSDYYGIVLRKGESDLSEKINTILNSLRQRGVLTLLKQKWLE